MLNRNPWGRQGPYKTPQRYQNKAHMLSHWGLPVLQIPPFRRRLTQSPRWTTGLRRPCAKASRRCTPAMDPHGWQNRRGNTRSNQWDKGVLLLWQRSFFYRRKIFKTRVCYPIFRDKTWIFWVLLVRLYFYYVNLPEFLGAGGLQAAEKVGTPDPVDTTLRGLASEPGVTPPA